MNINFENPGVNTAIWCMRALEEAGIHELRGLDTMKPDTRRLLLHLEDEDIEIWIERGNTTNDEPVYWFVKKAYSTVTHTSYSCSFTIE